MSDESTELRRGIRLDLIIAVCALLISSLATAASWWQSRVVAEQLSSQVWPYLTVSTTIDPSYVQIDIINDGLGPAIVRSVVLTIDGKPYPDPTHAVKALIVKRLGPIGAQMSDIAPASVIRAGGDVRLVRVNAAWFVPVFAQNARRIDLRLCYCSLLGKCWRTSSQANGDPQPVQFCPDPGADQFRVPFRPAKA
jgi:hypothetical protein